jgi:serine/threonine-protein kinase
MAGLGERVRRAVGDRYRLEPEPPAFPAAVPPWELFFATDTVLKWQVVIKALSMEGVDPVIGLRFEKEVGSVESPAGWLGMPAFAHARFHPILARSGRGDVLYYVTRWLPEGSLRVRLRREPRLPVAEAVRILDDVAEALEFLHRHGIAHHRVKPENVLFDAGRALLADSASRIAPGIGAEQLLYDSPEQVRGERGDARSDQHALAAVGFEMLAGRSPFEGTLLEVLYAKVNGAAPALTSLRPDVPEAVSGALSRAMAVRPEDRFADVAEFRAALRPATPS